MSTELITTPLPPPRIAWNKGRIVGQKRPLQPKHVWSIRIRLEMAGDLRDLALFNMAIDSKLRGCDLVRLKVRDVFAAGQVRERASVIQKKTGRPVRFEITETTRVCLKQWISSPTMAGMQYLWPSRFHDRPHMSTRQYARLLREWVSSIGLVTGMQISVPMFGSDSRIRVYAASIRDRGTGSTKVRAGRSVR